MSFDESGITGVIHAVHHLVLALSLTTNTRDRRPLIVRVDTLKGVPMETVGELPRGRQPIRGCAVSRRSGFDGRCGAERNLLPELYRVIVDDWAPAQVADVVIAR